MKSKKKDNDNGQTYYGFVILIQFLYIDRSVVYGNEKLIKNNDWWTNLLHKWKLILIIYLKLSTCIHGWTNFLWKGKSNQNLIWMDKFITEMKDNFIFYIKLATFIHGWSSLLRKWESSLALPLAPGISKTHKVIFCSKSNIFQEHTSIGPLIWSS